MRPVVRLTVLALLLLPALALLTRGHVEAQAGARCFPETGFCISGRIREFWEQNGGLAVFGFPISEQGPFQGSEGRTVPAQWFERQRLELHPENARPYDVLLGRLGVDRLTQQGRDWFTFPRATPAAASQAGCVFVAQTEHSVCEPFRAYYQRYGIEFDGRPGFSLEESLALFGLPISEAAPEVGSDGRERITQWFERARLEFHPELPPQFQVLGGLLGREVLDASRTPPTPTAVPTAVPTPAATPTVTPTPGPGPDGCALEMTFVRDVAIPNGSVLDPFAAFERIWRVRNDGSCTWRNYQIVFSRGDQLSAPAAVRIPEARSGQSIDISVPMIAPGAPGDYRGFWVLRASNGATFGGLIAAITVRSLPTPTPLPDAGALANTTWTLISLSGNQPLADTRPTLLFEGGTALGSTGCNTFRGPYRVSGATIAIGPLASTLVLCDDAISQQEATYLRALQEAAAWRIEGATLTLLNASGAEVARFTAGS
ncbi:MAG: META domain-containing protein [Chloroflexales bacterium]|nr:META domain-containing protein [Chloroflexales bacterium]